MWGTPNNNTNGYYPPPNPYSPSNYETPINYSQYNTQLPSPSSSAPPFIPNYAYPQEPNYSSYPNYLPTPISQPYQNNPPIIPDLPSIPPSYPNSSNPLPYSTTPSYSTPSNVYSTNPYLPTAYSNDLSYQTPTSYYSIPTNPISSPSPYTPPYSNSPFISSPTYDSNQTYFSTPTLMNTPPQISAEKESFFTKLPLSQNEIQQLNQMITSTSFFSEQPKEKQHELVQASANKKIGVGLIGKLSVKLSQVRNVASLSIESKISDFKRRIQYEYELEPPVGSFNIQEMEDLLRETNFSAIELELLHYEFCTHVFKPKPCKKIPNFKPIMNYEEFQRILPRCLIPGTENSYSILSSRLYSIFKWNNNSSLLNFESFVRFLNICNNSSIEITSYRIPIIYQLLADQNHPMHLISLESSRFILYQLIQLKLVCPAIGFHLSDFAKVDQILFLFFHNDPNLSLTLQQFNSIILNNLNNKNNIYNANVNNNLNNNSYNSNNINYPVNNVNNSTNFPPTIDPNWENFLDLYGLFSYINQLHYSHISEFFSAQTSNEMLSGRKPHKEGFLTIYSNRSIGEKWNRHWSVLDRGFLWFYPANNNFDVIERIYFIGEAKVIKSESKDDPPFCFEIIFNSNNNAVSIPKKFCAFYEEDLDWWIKSIELSKSYNPMASFAPIRDGISVKWFIDGKDTYRDMFHAIDSARDQIFITDWFLSPQVYLIRENDNGLPELNPKNRLDNLLKKKAEEGVKIFILPWSETKIAIDLGSANVKSTFEHLHKNIKVLCHPLMNPIKWSHHQKTIVIDQMIAFVGGLDLCFGRWDDQIHEITDVDYVQRFPGKDYYNPGIKELQNVQDPFKDLLDRNRHPRMPWHDVHTRIDGEAARDVALNFIQRWNHHRDCLTQHDYIIPNSSFLPKTSFSSVQLLRSVSEWSAGVTTTERSIYHAYLEEIENAEHFIYIENQFFISSTAGSPVENQISKKILAKIASSIKLNRPFKVIIILPVHPEGGYKEAATVRYIMGWQYKTICRGPSSMIESFREMFPNVNPTLYFHFYVLKSWGRMSDLLLSEQIYVHTKLMIVDDRTVIVGSANINDRSMLGTRDSEIAVVIKDRTKIDSKMGGENYSVSQFAHSLRINLFAEHLGLRSDNPILIDPICEETYSFWLSTAISNSSIYNNLFYKKYSIPFSEQNLEQLMRIKGHLVEYDQYFLCDDQVAKNVAANPDMFFTSDDIFI